MDGRHARPRLVAARATGRLCRKRGRPDLGGARRVGGVNTWIPTPWAVLRFVPGIGLVHSPGRFAVVVMTALSVLFALAVTELLRRHSRHRRLITVAMGAALLFELAPLPRPLRALRSRPDERGGGRRSSHPDRRFASSVPQRPAVNCQGPADKIPSPLRQEASTRKALIPRGRRAATRARSSGSW